MGSDAWKTLIRANAWRSSHGQTRRTSWKQVSHGIFLGLQNIHIWQKYRRSSILAYLWPHRCKSLLAVKCPKVRRRSSSSLDHLDWREGHSSNGLYNFRIRKCSWRWRLAELHFQHSNLERCIRSDKNRCAQEWPEFRFGGFLNSCKGFRTTGRLSWGCEDQVRPY